MKRSLRAMWRAVLMGLCWAVVWAPVGVLVGLIVDPDGSKDEPWVLIGAYPGFLCGVLFYAVLAIAERRQRLQDLALTRVGAWGASAGLLVGALPFTIGDSTSRLPVWLLPAIVISSITLLSVASALSSAYVIRRKSRAKLAAGA